MELLQTPLIFSVEAIRHNVCRPLARYTLRMGVHSDGQSLRVVDRFPATTVTLHLYPAGRFLCCLAYFLNDCSAMPASHSFCRKQPLHWLCKESTAANFNRKVPCLSSSIAALFQQFIILGLFVFIGCAKTLLPGKRQLYNPYFSTSKRPENYVCSCLV